MNSQVGGSIEEEALLLMKQVFEALQHLHSKEIAHGELKLENTVFAGHELKLIDFCLCYARRPGSGLESTSYAGTPLYAAPEVSKRVPYIPEEADMWSSGIMLYVIATGDKRYTCSSSVWFWDARPRFATETVRHLSRGTAALLGNLLHEDLCQRPSLDNALELLESALSKLDTETLRPPTKQDNRQALMTGLGLAAAVNSKYPADY